MATFGPKIEEKFEIYLTLGYTYGVGVDEKSKKSSEISDLVVFSASREEKVL
jgi:hypothetical protein